MSADMTPEEAKLAFDRAHRELYTLLGRIKSATKQAKHGSIQSAKIAESTLPSMLRRKDSLEKIIAETTPLLPNKVSSRLAPAAAQESVDLRSLYDSDEDFENGDIPPFLRR